MNETLVWLCGGTLLLLGLIGCIVPVLPGPLFGYAALWAMWVFGFSPGTARLALGGGIVVAVMIVDYVLPTYFAKKFRCTKSGMLGCFLGTIAGLFFFPWGIVVGPVLGTVFGELTAGRTLVEAARGGAGAFCGFVSCLLAKFLTVGLFIWWFVEKLMK